MGETAENLAVKYAIDREAQDAFAVESHRKAAAARSSGRLEEEIIPIQGKAGDIVADGCIREDTTSEALAALKPAFSDTGTVTAGTSSPLCDGAAATLITTEDFADKNGLEPLARILSIAVSGCSPEIMGIGPVRASLKALARGRMPAPSAWARQRGADGSIDQLSSNGGGGAGGWLRLGE